MRPYVVVLAVVCLAACGDSKSAGPDAPTAGDGGAPPASTTGSTTTTTDTTGPGALGALPTGYCCTKDDECRGRRCIDTAGSKMCADNCYGSPHDCERPELTGFTCDDKTDPDFPLCKPPAGTVCIEASKFQRGDRPSGACCSSTSDGTFGIECEGNLCAALDHEVDGVETSNPLVCTQNCVDGRDCPSPLVCTPLGDGRKQCLPGTDVYTCK